jgi:hypothetical protein
MFIIYIFINIHPLLFFKHKNEKIGIIAIIYSNFLYFISFFIEIQRKFNCQK